MADRVRVAEMNEVSWKRVAGVSLIPIAQKLERGEIVPQDVFEVKHTPRSRRRCSDLCSHNPSFPFGHCQESYFPVGRVMTSHPQVPMESSQTAARK